MSTANEQSDAQERRKKMQAVEDRPSVVSDVDEDGFLIKEGAWTKDVAQSMAPTIVHSDLNEDHWKVINYMRHYYSEYRTIPSVRKLSRDTGLSLRELKALFPDRVTMDACRLAGIPKHVIHSFHYTPY